VSEEVVAQEVPAKKPGRKCDYCGKRCGTKYSLTFQRHYRDGRKPDETTFYFCKGCYNKAAEV